MGGMPRGAPKPHARSSFCLLLTLLVGMYLVPVAKWPLDFAVNPSATSRGAQPPRAVDLQAVASSVADAGRGAPGALVPRVSTWRTSRRSLPSEGRPATVRQALKVDLTGKVAFLCGASSEKGYGWAIAKELAEAGATILFGSWPVGLKIFRMNFKKKAMEEARRLSDGSLMEIAKVYPLDAAYDVPSQVPEDILNNKRYQELGQGFTIQEVVDQVEKDFGKIDILVHALANGPEVTKPLLETTREGYLAASSASAYSLVSMVSRFGRLMRPGGAVVSITYMASRFVVPGYGGGMGSAKAQLESDTRTLAYEVGRKYGVRVNTICAGPLASRAATAIGGDGDKPFIMRAIEYSEANAPLTAPLTAEQVGKSAFFLLSPLATGVTGETLHVDNGLHVMGQALDSPAFAGLATPGNAATA